MSDSDYEEDFEDDEESLENKDHTKESQKERLSALKKGSCSWEEVSYEDIELREQIGGGGFAIVYRCKWKGKNLACKLMFDPNVDEKNKKEFMDELFTMV